VKRWRHIVVACMLLSSQAAMAQDAMSSGGAASFEISPNYLAGRPCLGCTTGDQSGNVPKIPYVPPGSAFCLQHPTFSMCASRRNDAVTFVGPDADTAPTIERPPSAAMSQFLKNLHNGNCTNCITGDPPIGTPAIPKVPPRKGMTGIVPNVGAPASSSRAEALARTDLWTFRARSNLPGAEERGQGAGDYPIGAPVIPGPICAQQPTSSTCVIQKQMIDITP